MLMMDELQKARADWLDALQKNVDLEAENQRLKQANFELTSKLIVAQTQAMMLEVSSISMASAFCGCA